MNISKQRYTTLSIHRIFFLGMSMLILTLALSLAAYYLYSHPLRQLSLILMLLSLILLFWAMGKDLTRSSKYTLVAVLLLFGLLLFYFMQRMEFHRFDFSVGDASDYFLAGICSVTYNQDIGYILPLSATLSAIGYDLFGIQNLPFIYVLFYTSSIPISYFIFRQLSLSTWLSFIMTAYFVFTPLSIWYAKSSFTEPIWQILLLILILNGYRILQHKHLTLFSLSTLYILLFLAPMLRAEGVLLYGFILFLLLYHLWKFSDLKSALFLSLGFSIVAVSVHISLVLRPGYLLDRQYSRLIPDVSTFKVMVILYTVASLLTLSIFLLYWFRKKYATISLPIIFVVLSILIKVLLAYVFAFKKQMPFFDIFIMNEIELAIGNFGIIMTLAIFFGILLLYKKAWRGELFALIIVILYTIFYIPFVMQSITFFDPHAFLFYWNRYYFSIFMLIHLFALALTLKFVLQNAISHIKNVLQRQLLFATLVFLLFFSSFNVSLYKIVVNESHLKGAYTFYEWVKNHVRERPLVLVTDTSTIYQQNARPDGQEAMKYFTYRTFSIYKMPIRDYQKFKPDELYSNVIYDADLSTVPYVLCLGTKECQLINKQLIKEDTFVLPLQWREHFGLADNAQSIHRGKIENSIIRHLPLHATLYRVKDTLQINQKLFFKQPSISNHQILSNGWQILAGSGAVSIKGKSTLTLPSPTEENAYSQVILSYAVMDASKTSTREVTFLLNDIPIKTVHIDSPYTKEIQLDISSVLPIENRNTLHLDISTSENGKFILRYLLLKG